MVLERRLVRKRIVSILLCVLLVGSNLTLLVNAAENSNVNEQIIVSQTIEYVGNDCYYPVNMGTYNYGPGFGIEHLIKDACPVGCA